MDELLHVPAIFTTQLKQGLCIYTGSSQAFKSMSGFIKHLNRICSVKFEKVISCISLRVLSLAMK